MMIFNALWHEFYNWAVGWGGLSALIGILSLLLWYFTPPILSSPEARAVLFNIGLGALAFTFVSGYYLTMGDKTGYSRAINEVAAKNRETIDEINKATTKVDECNASGGTWDTVSGVCGR